MPEVKKDILISVPIEKFFDIITDLENYQEFIPEIQRVKVLEKSEKQIVAEFEIKMVKTIHYKLKFEMKRPVKFAWALMESSDMKLNQGLWELEKINDTTTKAIYSVEIQMKGVIPKSITDKLGEIHLPSLLKQFKERAERLCKA